MLKYLFIPVIIISSCSQRHAGNETNVDTIQQDSLEIFPFGYQMEFVGTNANDQIALHIKKENAGVFSYRIELLRKWKGTPLDYGEVKIKKIDSDSAYFFEGGNSSCSVLIRIYKKQEKHNETMFATLQRTCSHDSLNITVDEFPELWNKSNGFSK